FIEPLEKTLAPARIDLEAVPLPQGRGDRLRFQIDTDATCALRRFDLGRKTIDDVFVHNDGQNPILETIGEEDIAETRADDRADTHFLERPHGPLTRGAATEIRTGDQYFGLPVRFAIEDEFGILRSVGQIAQRAKCPFAKCATNVVADQTFDPDDDVRIDIAPHDRRGDCRKCVEWPWHVQRPIVRTSAMAPAIAAAAALAGLARWVRA